MSYEQAVEAVLSIEGMAMGTMMQTPCLRYRGSFVAMMFEKEDALIIKVSSERVNALIAEGKGVEFTFTKKRFKEWVLIPLEFGDEYEAFLREAVACAQGSASS